MALDPLISHFLLNVGLFDDIEPKEIPINRRIVCNYREWPLITAIFSRVNKVWATGPHVHCVMLGTIHSVNLHIHDGEVRWAFEDTSRTDIVNQIQTHETRIRWVFIPLGVEWIAWKANDPTQGDHPLGHSAVLVVDTVCHTYSLFDPNNGDMQIKDERQPTKTRFLNRYDLFLVDHHKDFIPGYECVDRRQEGGDSSLQSVVDTTDENVKREFDEYIQEVPGGLCSILTLLVLVCCLRFQRGDPWIVADSIKRTFMSMGDATKEKFRVNITTWYMNIYRAKRWRGVAELMGVCNVLPHDDPCGVLSEIDGSHCTKPACPRNTLCEQHYYELVLQSLEAHDDFVCFITHDVLDLCGPFQ